MVISRVAIVITYIRGIRGLITPLLATHEPPSPFFPLFGPLFEPFLIP